MRRKTNLVITVAMPLYGTANNLWCNIFEKWYDVASPVLVLQQMPARLTLVEIHRKLAWPYWRNPTIDEARHAKAATRRCRPVGSTVPAAVKVVASLPRQNSWLQR